MLVKVNRYYLFSHQICPVELSPAQLVPPNCPPISQRIRLYRNVQKTNRRINKFYAKGKKNLHCRFYSNVSCKWGVKKFHEDSITMRMFIIGGAGEHGYRNRPENINRYRYIGGFDLSLISRFFPKKVVIAASILAKYGRYR